MNTEELITACFDKIKGANDEHASKSIIFPLRLIPHLKYIFTKFMHGVELDSEDIDFLTTFLNTPNSELLDVAYVCGQFVKYKSHTHRNYNVKSQKEVKTCYVSRYNAS